MILVSLISIADYNIN